MGYIYSGKQCIHLKGSVDEIFKRTNIIGNKAGGTVESMESREDERARLQTITEDEVSETIRKLKRKKAAGQDQIANKAWMFGEEELLEGLTTVLNEIWNGGEIPQETVTIRPIYKKRK